MKVIDVSYMPQYLQITCNTLYSFYMVHMFVRTDDNAKDEKMALVVLCKCLTRKGIDVDTAMRYIFEQFKVSCYIVIMVL